MVIGKTEARAQTSIIISTADQRMVVFHGATLVERYLISTSKYGLGDRSQSYETPLGIFTVVSRIGEGAPQGAVFKGRRMTGEVVSPNAPGRDAIVTRILQLRGLTDGAAHALDRGIYIHGTPAESQLGRPASYGCIRMRSRDIVRLFDEAPVGTKIAIIKTPIAKVLARARIAAN
jgi:lipoprotein-anchoring transpeptidase ErfK/SrfK